MDSKDMAQTVEPLHLVDDALILEAYRYSQEREKETERERGGK
jgi:hypothetical protein